MLQVRGGQGSEQRRKRAPYLAEVLQKPSVKRFSTMSCNGLRTPREPRRNLFRSSTIHSAGSHSRDRKVTFTVLADELAAAAHAELWPKLVAEYPTLGEHQARTTRQFPVFILTRQD
jgi:hypothetical protein